VPQGTVLVLVTRVFRIVVATSPEQGSKGSRRNKITFSRAAVFVDIEEHLAEPRQRRYAQEMQRDVMSVSNQRYPQTRASDSRTAGP